MSTVFTKIIERKLPAHIVADDDDYLAFLDINPLAKGHVLVIPKKEVDYVFDLDTQTLEGLFSFAKGVAKAIEKVITCERIGILVLGTEVPHAHVHLIPIAIGNTHFGKKILSLSEEEYAETASKIKEVYEK